jgi:hypothetical protein
VVVSGGMSPPPADRATSARPRCRDARIGSLAVVPYRTPESKKGIKFVATPKAEIDVNGGSDPGGSAWTTVAVVILVAGALWIVWIWNCYPTIAARSEAAQFWGSLVSAVMSAAAFCAFLAALEYQRRDLRAQRDDLELQREELRLTRQELKGQREEMRKTREMNERHFDLAEMHLRQSMEATAEARFTALAELRIALTRDLLVHGRLNVKQHEERIVMAAEFCKSALAEAANDPMLGSDRRETLGLISKNL